VFKVCDPRMGAREERAHVGKGCVMRSDTEMHDKGVYPVATIQFQLRGLSVFRASNASCRLGHSTLRVLVCPCVSVCIRVCPCVSLCVLVCPCVSLCVLVCPSEIAAKPTCNDELNVLCVVAQKSFQVSLMSAALDLAILNI